MRKKTIHLILHLYNHGKKGMDQFLSACTYTRQYINIHFNNTNNTAYVYVHAHKRRKSKITNCRNTANNNTEN